MIHLQRRKLSYSNTTVIYNRNGKIKLDIPGKAQRLLNDELLDSKICKSK